MESAIELLLSLSPTFPGSSWPVVEIKMCHVFSIHCITSFVYQIHSSISLACAAIFLEPDISAFSQQFLRPNVKQESEKSTNTIVLRNICDDTLATWERRVLAAVRHDASCCGGAVHEYVRFWACCRQTNTRLTRVSSYDPKCPVMSFFTH